MGQVPSTPAQGPPFDNGLNPDIDYTFDIDNGLRVKDSDSNTAWELAIGITGIVVVFTIWHWSRHFALTRASTTPRSGSGGPNFLMAPARLARKHLVVAGCKGFTSGGHVIVVIVYIAINVVLLFTDLDWSLTSNFARRLGWVCTINIAFLFFLALKLQPLGFLTGFTYQRLNVLHQIAGYTTVLLALMHTLVFVASRNQQGLSYNLGDDLQRPGIVAALLMTGIALTSLTMRKRWYEAFYLIHVIAAIFVLVTVYRHRPYVQTQTVWIVLVAAVFLLYDKLFRWARYAGNARGTHATLHPLLNNANRILLNKSSKDVRRGEHIWLWLWLPSVNRTQTHPFTVVNNDPLEIVMAAHHGLTQKVNELATLHPGISVRAAWDGPYGKLPLINLYNRILLVAGGSGGSWTMALAMTILDQHHHHLPTNLNLQLDFIWVVRNNETPQSHFPTQLARLAASPRVNLILHHTSPPTPAAQPITDKASASAAGAASSHHHHTTSTSDEKPLSKPPVTAHNTHTHTHTHTHHATDEEVLPSPPPPPPPPLPSSVPGRPNITNIIMEAITAAPSRGKERCLLVGVCGPASMIKDVRKGIAKGTTSGGPGIGAGTGVDLWIEEYGW